MPFTAGELAQRRAESAAKMPDTFRVSVPGATVSDGSGGEYATNPTTEDYPCRKAPVGNGPQERLLAAQIQEVGTEVMVLPWTVDLEVGTVGAWLSTETDEERAYRIVAAPFSSYSVERRYLVVPASTVEA